jgi:acyl transferase domain-containing protein
VLSLNDALALVAARGRLMQSAERGAMLSVPLPEAEVQAMLGSHLSLASVNAPALCVVSGPTNAIAELEEKLKAKDVLCRRLHTSHAFHSQMMEPILDAFRAEVDKAALNAPAIPFVSNLTGTWIKAAEVTDAEYWVRHLRQTVRFGEGVTRLFDEPDAILLEVGPGATLMTIARWHPAKAAGQMVLTSLPRSEEPPSDLVSLQNSVGRLWMSGVKIGWTSYFASEERRRVSLPTYPFERRRYWIEPGQQTAGAIPAAHGLRKKENLTEWFYIPAWKSSAAPARFEFLTVNAEHSSYVLLADECGLAERLAAKLKNAGADVTMVCPAARSALETGGLYSIYSSPLVDEDTAQPVTCTVVP